MKCFNSILKNGRYRGWLILIIRMFFLLSITERPTCPFGQVRVAEARGRSEKGKARNLESYGLTKMVGASRFERPTTCTPSKYATRLRHAPMCEQEHKKLGRWEIERKPCGGTSQLLSITTSATSASPGSPSAPSLRFPGQYREFPAPPCRSAFSWPPRWYIRLYRAAV